MHTKTMMPSHVPAVVALAASILLAACGGGSGGGGGTTPPDPTDQTPPTVQVLAPVGGEALIPGDDLHVEFRADDDLVADVEVVLDVDADPSTTGDQTVLFQGTDQNGALTSVDLDTTTVPVGPYVLFVIADDGVHAPVCDGGAAVIIYPGLAGVSPPRRTAYGVVGNVVVFSVGEAEQGGQDLDGDGDSGDGVMTLLDGTGVILEMTGMSVDVSIAGQPTAQVLPSESGWVVWHRREADETAPLNPDPDFLDVVPAYARDVSRYSPTGGVTLTAISLPDGRVVRCSEPSHSLDLNGDGDVLDEVVGVLDFNTDQLAVAFNPQIRPGTGVVGASMGNFAAFLVDEASQGPGNLGADLNGDGDMLDTLVAIVDVTGCMTVTVGIGNADPTAAFAVSANTPFTCYYVDESLVGAGPLNGDGDTTDFVPTVNTGGGEVVPGTGLNGGPGARFAFADGPKLLYVASEEGAVDRNGDGDTTDTEVLHWTDAVAAPATSIPVPPPAGLPLAGLTLDGGSAAHIAAGWLSIVVSETANGTDLNGDTDTSDAVFMLVDLTATPPVVHNTGLVSLAPAGLPLPGCTIPDTGVGGHTGVVVQATETANGDLNSDGDQIDTLLFYFDFSSPQTRVALSETGGMHATVAAGMIAVTAYEALTGADLDGDGDATGFALRIFDTAGTVVEPGRTSNQYSVPATDDGMLWAYLRSEIEEDCDFNGDGDRLDQVLGLWLP